MLSDEEGRVALHAAGDLRGRQVLGALRRHGREPAQRALAGRQEPHRVGGTGRGQREIRAVITDVLERNVERASGAVALQGYNILIRALEAERRVREQALIEERLDELEERLEQAKREEGLHGGGYYG